MTEVDDRKEIDLVGWELERERASQEYSHIIDLMKFLAQMIWAGYGAFFAINTLLATGFALVFNSEYPNIYPNFALGAEILICALGAFLALSSIFVIRNIYKAYITLVERALEIERQIGSTMISLLSNSWRKWPWGTVVGGLFFSALWAGALVLSMYVWMQIEVD